MSNSIMSDKDCISFLQWSLPKLHFHWPGFRKVRRQVCRRIQKRLNELGLSDHKEYQQYLMLHPDEWNILDSFCYISLSRFFRDKMVYEILNHKILPYLATTKGAQRNRIDAWSLGCCSGEEPYSLKILWELGIKDKSKSETELHIAATDINPRLIQRAQAGTYSAGSLKELPSDFLKYAFDPTGQSFYLKDQFKKNIQFLQQDIRKQFPEGSSDLILCRNLAFTYFDRELQNVILEKLIDRLHGSGFLIIGAHEKLPYTEPSLSNFESQSIIFRKKNKT
ncbi:MAG: chemotaxis protein CheR [bacterium]|nr:MAG: chemotaxis protein CheR [bacterium]